MLSSIFRNAQKTKLAYEDAERSTLSIISRGERQYPSWINDRNWQKTFAESTLEEALKSGLTKDQATLWFSQQGVADIIMTMTAQLEKANFSKLGQISGAMEFTGKLAAAQAREWQSKS